MSNRLRNRLIATALVFGLPVVLGYVAYEFEKRVELQEKLARLDAEQEMILKHNSEVEKAISATTADCESLFLQVVIPSKELERGATAVLMGQPIREDPINYSLRKGDEEETVELWHKYGSRFPRLLAIRHLPGSNYCKNRAR